VYVLRRLGFDATGLEPDEEYARHAREELGVPVNTGFVQDVSFAPRSFDAVTMYHALEHVEDPVAILSRLRSWMTDDGLLLIEVPNVEARCIAPAHRLHFAHFYSFSRATLEAVAQSAGFRPVQTTMSSDGGNLINVFRAGVAVAAQVDSDNYRRVASVLRDHTTLKYYCSPWPYVRPFTRLHAYVVDRRAAAGYQTPKQVLDALLNGSA
jgi:SAM-dependent methyltransferase